VERRLEQCGLGTCLAVGARVLGVAVATVRLGLQVVRASGAVLTRITVAVGPYTDAQPTVTTRSRHLTNCIRRLDTPTSHDSLTVAVGPYTDTQPTVTTRPRHLTNCIRRLDNPTSHNSLTLSLKTYLLHIHTYYY